MAIAIGGGVFELGDALVLGGWASAPRSGPLHAVWQYGGRRLFPPDSLVAPPGGRPVALPEQVISTLDLGLGRHRLELVIGEGGAPVGAPPLEVEVVDPGQPTLAPLALPAYVWPPQDVPADVWIETRAGDRYGRTPRLDVVVEASGGASRIVDVDAKRGMVHLRLEPDAGRVLRYEVAVSAIDERGLSSTARIHIALPPRPLTSTPEAP